MYYIYSLAVETSSMHPPTAIRCLDHPSLRSCKIPNSLASRHLQTACESDGCASSSTKTQALAWQLILFDWRAKIERSLQVKVDSSVDYVFSACVLDDVPQLLLTPDWMMELCLVDDVVRFSHFQASMQSTPVIQVVTHTTVLFAQTVISVIALKPVLLHLFRQAEYST